MTAPGERDTFEVFEAVCGWFGDFPTCGALPRGCPEHPCTRPPGHYGRHVAVDEAGALIASWKEPHHEPAGGR